MAGPISALYDMRRTPQNDTYKNELSNNNVTAYNALVKPTYGHLKPREVALTGTRNSTYKGESLPKFQLTHAFVASAITAFKKQGMSDGKYEYKSTGTKGLYVTSSKAEKEFHFSWHDKVGGSGSDGSLHVKGPSNGKEGCIRFIPYLDECKLKVTWRIIRSGSDIGTLEALAVSFADKFNTYSVVREVPGKFGCPTDLDKLFNNVIEPREHTDGTPFQFNVYTDSLYELCRILINDMSCIGKLDIKPEKNYIKLKFIQDTILPALDKASKELDSRTGGGSAAAVLSCQEKIKNWFINVLKAEGDSYGKRLVNVLINAKTRMYISNLRQRFKNAAKSVNVNSINTAIAIATASATASATEDATSATSATEDATGIATGAPHYSLTENWVSRILDSASASLRKGTPAGIADSIANGAVGEGVGGAIKGDPSIPTLPKVNNLLSNNNISNYTHAGFTAGNWDGGEPIYTHPSGYGFKIKWETGGAGNSSHAKVSKIIEPSIIHIGNASNVSTPVATSTDVIGGTSAPTAVDTSTPTAVDTSTPTAVDTPAPTAVDTPAPTAVDTATGVAGKGGRGSVKGGGGGTSTGKGGGGSVKGGGGGTPTAPTAGKGGRGGGTSATGGTSAIGKTCTNTKCGKSWKCKACSKKKGTRRRILRLRRNATRRRRA